MIYVKVHYGLGNQMFQYAFGRSLSLALKIPFKLDTSFYKHERVHGEADRKYGLNAFNTEQPIASDEEILRFTRPSFWQRRYRQFEKIALPFQLREFIPEVIKPFDPRVFKIKGTTYFTGYWQSEMYFKAFESEIRNDFTFKHEINNQQKVLFDAIRENNSVCVHIRRGDYLTDKFAINNIVPCDLEYYYSAVQYIRERVKHPHFYIFSDDINWAKANFNVGDSMTFVEDQHKGLPDHEYLRLMASCKHFIIANSSFSWWGAWLGRQEGKIVIGPKEWFKNGINILPEPWLKL